MVQFLQGLRVVEGASFIAAPSCGLYLAQLGAEVIRTMQGGTQRVDLRLGGQFIFIMPVGPNETVNPPPVTPCLGLDHIGFFVKDIDVVNAELKAKGAEFTREIETPRPGIRLLFLRGPHGISVELLERDEKYR